MRQGDEGMGASRKNPNHPLQIKLRLRPGACSWLVATPPSDPGFQGWPRSSSLGPKDMGALPQGMQKALPHSPAHEALQCVVGGTSQTSLPGQAARIPGNARGMRVRKVLLPLRPSSGRDLGTAA